MISKISSLDFCCDVTRLENTLQRFRAQVPFLHPLAQLLVHKMKETIHFLEIFRLCSDEKKISKISSVFRYIYENQQDLLYKTLSFYHICLPLWAIRHTISQRNSFAWILFFVFILNISVTLKEGVSLHSQPKVRFKEYFVYFLMRQKSLKNLPFRKCWNIDFTYH